MTQCQWPGCEQSSVTYIVAGQKSSQFWVCEEHRDRAEEEELERRKRINLRARLRRRLRIDQGELFTTDSGLSQGDSSSAVSSTWRDRDPDPDSQAT